MNKLFLLCTFFAASIVTSAQKVTISPLPQNITWGEKAFQSTDMQYKLVGDVADPYATDLLKKSLTIDDAASLTITIGEADDPAVSAYASEIPVKAEGYYLCISPDGIVVAGRDEAGTFWGTQSLLQILSQPEVYAVTIKDFPACAQRGVIEGFYGNPWSTADRKSQFDFYGANKMNIYVYGPKDDPYHRSKWRENYPTAEGKVIKELAEHARKNHVDFVWAIHTGGSISNSESDFQAVVNKLENVYSLGVRNFSIFFDDFGGADATLQAAECNYVWDNFVEKHDDVSKLSMCPTKYNAAYAGWNSSDSYLNELGSKMNNQIEIMWTGDGVADMINQSDINFFKTATGRYPFIWLNYPVNDYCIGHLLMGKFYGNDTGKNTFGSYMTAFTSNPMEYAEASKVALYSIADYAWNMKDYDPQTSWERAIPYLMPNSAEAFHVFCEHNVDLGVTVHGMRREGESPNFDTSAPRSDIKVQYDLMVESADKLLADTYNPALIKEISPWLLKMKYMGQRGQKEIEMWQCIEDGNTQLFLQDYNDIKAIQALEDALISRDFEGTIKSARPVVADQKVAPYLKQQLLELVTTYKTKYTEGWDNFDAVVLENGNYYVKVNGKYLYNKNASSTRTGDFPILVDDIDDAQPQKCEWTITMDGNTGRYKIVNTQDGRYLNEKGAFWSNATNNPYDSEWHSYDIFCVNGRYAIQTTSKASGKFLTASPSRIEAGSSTQLRYWDAIFELIPVSGDTISHPTFDQNHSYYIMDKDGNCLTAATSLEAWSKPTFKAKSTSSTMSKYQKWVIIPDPAYGRWKIAHAANTAKFLDEVGRINKNVYYSDWNSLSLAERNGQWAIECVTKDAVKYWGINDDNQIALTDKALNDSYLFTIVEAGSYSEKAVTPKVPTGYVTVFAEDFDGEGEPTAEKWSRTDRSTAAWNRFCSDDSRVVFLKDGALHCLAMPNDDTSKDNVVMLSGGIKTQNKFAFKYGIAEARIKTHQYPGNFPAFWMMPQENVHGGWPKSGEIDIWEAINQEQKAYGTVHTNWTWNLGKGGNSSNMGELDYTNWHVFRVMWDETSISWFVDGNKMWTYTKDTSDEAVEGNQWPFDETFYLILNQSVGNGSWASNPDTNHTYETLFDWVRVYQKKGSGIDSPSVTNMQDNTVYNLSGQRLSAPRKGINIIGGKKVLH